MTNRERIKEQTKGRHRSQPVSEIRQVYVLQAFSPFLYSYMELIAKSAVYDVAEGTSIDIVVKVFRKYGYDTIQGTFQQVVT